MPPSQRINAQTCALVYFLNTWSPLTLAVCTRRRTAVHSIAVVVQRSAVAAAAKPTDMLVLRALATSSFMNSLHAVGPLQAVNTVGSRFSVLMCGEEGIGTHGRVAQLENAVNDYSSRLGLQPIDCWENSRLGVDVLEEYLAELQHQWRAHEDTRLRNQMERYVQSLERQLLSLSMTYETIDRVCDVPMVPERALNDEYISALETAVAVAQRSASDRAPAVYWCDDDFVRATP